MGTHPIFESDFDCLTDVHVSGEKEVFKELEKIELIVIKFFRREIFCPEPVLCRF